jgi:pimeloyl-ACP methyl ester carboxylesterase
MLRRAWISIVFLASLGATLCAQQPAAWHDPSAHKIQFVAVDKNVRLEVLDWGGSGRAIVFLSGLGGTAHLFDEFAPKLTSAGHVYGITRRGFGASSVPASGYEADRLGDDVLAVLNALKLSKPVLVGESLSGEELSSVGSRYPGRVSGLVYLDAAYQYAFENGKGTTLEELQRIAAPEPPEPGAADLASFPAYQAWFKRINGIALPEAEFRQTMDAAPDGSVGRSRASSSVGQAVFAGMKKYSDIRVPVLAIFAVPHDLGPWLTTNQDPAVRTAADAFSAHEAAWAEKQAKAFEDGVPSARVIRLAHANHIVFLSNEADVLREMRAFLATLK